MSPIGNADALCCPPPSIQASAINMNPYTPPKQDPDAETVGSGNLEEFPAKKTNRWTTIVVYFSVIFGVGLAASVATSIFIPDATLSAPAHIPTGLRAHLAIGGILAMLVCPIVAGFRYWGVGNYLIASSLALGLLLGNAGFGIGLSLFSLFILYGTQRLFQLIIYYKSYRGGQTGACPSQNGKRGGGSTSQQRKPSQVLRQALRRVGAAGLRRAGSRTSHQYDRRVARHGCGRMGSMEAAVTCSDHEPG